MKARRGGRFSRWAAPGATLLIAALYLLNLPFYSGSTIASRFDWRMEHGRLTFGPCVPHTESFYIAPNSEGLRFAPVFRFSAWDDWSVKLPLWAPLAAAGAWAVWAWRPRKRLAGVCAKCGYSLAGLPVGAAACPECGKPGRPSTSDAS